jgi:hypothetical protein
VGSTTALIELGGVDHMTAVIELGTSGSQIAQIMLEQMQLPPEPCNRHLLAEDPAAAPRRGVRVALGQLGWQLL